MRGGSARSILELDRRREPAASASLPAIKFEEFVDAAGLNLYGASIDGMVQRATLIVDRILRGAPISGQSIAADHGSR